MAAQTFIFSKAGEAELTRLARSRTLYVFDFDGTVAPAGPGGVPTRPSLSLRRAAQALCERADVLLISAQPLSELVPVLGFTPRWTFGCHGVEGSELDPDALAECKAVASGWLAPLRDTLAAMPGGEAVRIEDRGLALALNYRLAAPRRSMGERLAQACRALEPAPRVHDANWVIHLLPPGSPAKDETIRRLVVREGFEAVLFAGDDATDEAVFATAPPDWVTVRVGRSPDSAARFHLYKSEEMVMLLQAIARRLGPG